ncbi:recQ-mediated genome instability protein 1 [Malania oleifera]|uniref:recQ-mediated genome instability protein 1 n=1 Tax=Malania oleifera TaxID=397392 RepID=UPI0025AE406E|nr:recQ-mediated genome instability protein 1 [Malania oleifera]
MRRRLRLRYSSDEEDEEEDQQPQHPHQQHLPEDIEDEDDDILVQVQASAETLNTVTLTCPDPNPNPNPDEPAPLEISDDDFVDASENPPPPPPPPLPPPIVDLSSFQFQEASMPSSGTSFAESSGCPLGESLRRLGLSLRREWLDSCICGLENSVPGFASFDVARKAKLCFEQFLFSDMNHSGGGVLPENVAAMHLVDLAGPFVLQVDEIVNISCPLRGRYQNATSGIKRCLKLSMTDGVQRVFGMEYKPIKTLEVLAPAGLKIAIFNVHIRRGLLMLVPEVFEVLGGLVDELEAARQRLVHEVNKPPRGKRTRNGVLPPLATRATLTAWPRDGGSIQGNSNHYTLHHTSPFRADGQGATFAASGTATRERNVEEFAVPIGRENGVSGVDIGERNVEEFGVRISRESATFAASGVDFSEGNVEEFAVSTSRENDEHNQSTNAVSDAENIHMVDGVEHPFILSGDKEIPFTYLASLSAKWAAMREKARHVQGTIKCFLTGVKGFHYKQRTTYELLVYVDDGSLISEILIDHNVVQKGIGHSPAEVTAALASSDTKKVSNMREILKQFQVFLVNFEGTMLVEMNESFAIPIALEMNQGCPASDAWLLLRRLKPSTSQAPQQHQLDPINISP